MRRAVLAGVETIEHGDDGTPEVFALMAERGITLCPTIAASEAMARYRGFRVGIDPEPERLQRKRKSFEAALAAGVAIANGSDVGVFAHGNNARELELLVAYGMTPLEALRSATRGAASALHLRSLGAIAAGKTADLCAVEGDPSREIGALRDVRFVMKGGQVVE
jgi:imidazolonepropionase-like amidohydrolase